MNPESPDPSDRPLLPPQSEAGNGLLRWAVAAVALVVLVVGAWQAYAWLVGDVARRRAVAEHAVEPTASAAESAAAPASPSPTGTGGGRTVQPPQAGSSSGEPPAPAVVGGAVNKCVLDGQVTYTNAACPEGSQPAVVSAAGVDPNGVVGSTGDSVPAVVERPAALAGGSDPAQQEADCAFLSAEIARLDYEFRQPLPPAVLDHISSRLANLRGRASSARCAPPPKAAAAPASAPARRAPSKVMDEKADPAGN